METINLKGQNVIKYLLYIVIVFSSNCMLCQQQIVGRYSSLMPNQEYYHYFDFHANGTFEYHSGASLGDDEFGKGHYKIKKDSLILNYDLTEVQYDSYYKSQRYFNSKDSIKIIFNAYNFDNTSIHKLQIYSYPNYNSTITDFDGKAMLSFKKEKLNTKIEIHIEGEFLVKQIIHLDLSANYIFNVYMKSSVIIGFGHPRAIKDEIKKYALVALRDDSIKLNHNGKVVELIKRPK